MKGRTSVKSHGCVVLLVIALMLAGCDGGGDGNSGAPQAGGAGGGGGGGTPTTGAIPQALVGTLFAHQIFGGGVGGRPCPSGELAQQEWLTTLRLQANGTAGITGISKA